MRRALFAFILLVAPAFTMAAQSEGDSTETEGESAEAADLIDPRETFAMQRYGGDGNYQISLSTDAAFQAAFPDYKLYVYEDWRVYPPIQYYFAWNPRTSTGFDISSEYSYLLADAQAVLLTDNDVRKFGRPYIHLADADLQFQRVMVAAGDASRLGYPVTNPTVTQSMGVATLKAYSWLDQNGILTEWSLEFTPLALTQATWSVKKIGADLRVLRTDARNIAIGDTIVSTFSPDYSRISTRASEEGPLPLYAPRDVLETDCGIFTNRTNFDGTEWKACRATGEEPLPDSILTLGAALTDAGVNAYDHLVAGNPACSSFTNPQENLGFQIFDPDCVYYVEILRDTDLLCFVCPAVPIPIPTPPCGFDPACAGPTKIYVHPAFKEFLNALQAYTDPTIHTTSTVAEVVIGHEFFHIIQWAKLGKYSHWPMMIEGQARFIETIVSPEASWHPSSMFFYDIPPSSQRWSAPNSGAQGWQYTPSSTPCSRSGYPAALFWGYLYSRNGGSTVLKASLDAAKAHDSTTSCADNLAPALDSVLSSMAGDDSSMRFVVSNLSWAMMTRDFSWAFPGGANYEWGTYLNAPFREQMQVQTSDKRFAMQGWSRVYANLPVDRDYELSCSAGIYVYAEIYRKLPGGPLEREPYSCKNFNSKENIVAHQYQELILVGIRGYHTDADISIRARAPSSSSPCVPLPPLITCT